MMLGKSFFYPLNKEWMEQEGWQVYGQDELLPLYDTNGKLAEQSRMILEHFAGSSTISMEQLLKPMMEDIAWLYDQGVNVVTGTDVGGRPYILPGISLHEEMKLLQMGGMDPLDIIRTTTRNAALMLGVLEDYGTVETGKYADLVILARNPLEDITHTRSITRVIKHGEIQQRIQPGSGD